jgi:hypothetical protein
MAYVRSLREIPLDEEPHASVLAALLPVFDPDEDGSPSMMSTGVNWDDATPDQIAHIRICPQCDAALGGLGRVCLIQTCDIFNPLTNGG